MMDSNNRAPLSGKLVEHMARAWLTTYHAANCSDEERDRCQSPATCACDHHAMQAALRVAFPVIRDMCAEEAASHRFGEQLIRHKMSHVDQVGVVAATIERAIKALSLSDLPGNGGQQ